MRGLKPAARRPRILSRLADSRSGGVVPFVAAAVPVIALLGVGAAELAALTADRAKLQDVADAVALDAAQELAFTVNEGVIERTKADTLAKLSEMTTNRPSGSMEVVPTIVFNEKGDPDGMIVAITARRQSFFGNMLPPGGFVTKVESTALRMGKAPLCVLAFSKTQVSTVTSLNTASMSAGKCRVHSNHEMIANSSNPITTAAAEAVTRASGNIQPTALIGAEPVEDPFAGKNLWPATGCASSGTETIVEDGITYVSPGVHCSKITARKNSTLVLRPGDHYFSKGGLTVQDQAKVMADDVVLIFDKDSTVNFRDASLIDFTGRKTGQFAGFVVVATRDNANPFRLTAGNVVNLHGTVYVPAADLIVEGAGKVAEQSAWTVIVAKALTIQGSANLIINANYRGSPVPVPKGVGNKSVDKTKNARLKK